MADATTTLGGRARDAAGNLADMPHDMAQGISHDLHDVLTLMHCAVGEVEAIGGEDDTDPDKLNDASSRAVALLSMGGDKVRAILKRMRPYV